jgi:hypothetical protein
MTTVLGAGATNGDVPVWSSSTNSWVSTAKFDDYRGPAGFIRRDSGTPQVIPTAAGSTYTQVTDFDYCEPTSPAFSMWNSGANGLLTVQKDGIYLVTAQVAFAANANGYREVSIWEGAPGAWEMRASNRVAPPPTGTCYLSVTWVGSSVATTDKYSIWVRQSSGGNLSLVHEYKVCPRLSAAWIRVPGMYA